jgi:hypothetical protein
MDREENQVHREANDDQQGELNVNEIARKCFALTAFAISVGMMPIPNATP